jgi:hypothetical protein
VASGELSASSGLLRAAAAYVDTSSLEPRLRERRLGTQPRFDPVVIELSIARQSFAWKRWSSEGLRWRDQDSKSYPDLRPGYILTEQAMIGCPG